MDPTHPHRTAREVRRKVKIDWIISDTHFGHVRIVNYEPMRRAWGSTAVEMTATMLRAWETTVRPDETVLHLGDVMMGSREMWPAYRARMTGRLILVRGNHDPTTHARMALLRPDEVHDRYEFDHPTLGHVICRHDPHEFTDADYDAADLLLHGHLHSGNHREDTPERIRSKCICVSVERLPSAPAPMRLDLVNSLRGLAANFP